MTRRNTEYIVQSKVEKVQQRSLLVLPHIEHRAILKVWAWVVLCPGINTRTRCFCTEMMETLACRAHEQIATGVCACTWQKAHSWYFKSLIRVVKTVLHFYITRASYTTHCADSKPWDALPYNPPSHVARMHVVATHKGWCYT